MSHDYRRSARYPLFASVELVAGNTRIPGRSIDISPLGIGLTIESEYPELQGPPRHWLCRVVSSDLPAATEFVVLVRRRRARGHRLELGCEITGIRDQSRACLRAYRALAQARAYSRGLVH